MNFCPEWVFDICCARAAQEFISHDLELETYAKKYERGLAEHYEAISYSLFYEGAEEMLRFLDEIGEEAAAETLHSFIYSLLLLHQCKTRTTAYTYVVLRFQVWEAKFIFQFRPVKA